VRKKLEHNGSFPNAQRVWSTAQFTNCAAQLINCAAHLANCAAIVRVWSTVAQLVKCRAFGHFVIGAARLAKCADWSNAPYNDTRI